MDEFRFYTLLMRVHLDNLDKCYMKGDSINGRDYCVRIQNLSHIQKWAFSKEMKERKKGRVMNQRTLG